MTVVREIDLASQICLSCPPKIKCCRNFEAPFLATYDITKIQHQYPHLDKSFYQEVDQPGVGKIDVMRQSDSRTCLALATDGRCSILRAKPLDCQLFPLDLSWEEGRIWWIVYYQFCPLGSIDEEILKKKTRLFGLAIRQHFSQEELRLFLQYETRASIENKYHRLWSF